MCIKWAVTYICWTLTHSTWIATYYWWASTFVLGHPRIYLGAHKFSWLSTYLIGHPCWSVDTHIHTWVLTHKPGGPHRNVVAHILVWTPTYMSGKPRIQMGVHICCMGTHSGLWSRLDAICDSPSMPTRLQNWAEKPRSLWASTRIHEEVCAPSRRFARKTRLATPAKFGKPHAFCLEVHRWPYVQVDAHTSVGTCEHMTHEHGCKRNVLCAPLLRGRAAARNWWYQARYVDARICVRECERMQVRASECVRCVCGCEYVACVVRHVCAGCEWVSTMRHVSWAHVGRQQKIPTPKG